MLRCGGALHSAAIGRKYRYRGKRLDDFVEYTEPAGYGLNTGVAPGTTVGTVDAVAQIGSTTVTIPTGNIVADTPANYTSNPEAQACAPGAHAAVWVAHAASFAIPLYVDPTSSTESSLGAFKLQACFTSPDSPGA